MSSSPYAEATPDKLDEIIRLGEARLAAQLTLGVAADQRAMTFASFLAAVEGVVIATYVAIKPSGLTKWSLLAMMIGFGLATLMALWAAKPVAWDIPGSRPGNWLQDIEQGDTLHNGRAFMAGFMDEMILDNDNTLSANARSIRISLGLVFATLIIAGLIAALS